MKRADVIEELKSGGQIIYSQGYDSTAFFAGTKATGETVNIMTALWLIKQKLVNIRESKTASGLSYLTWKQK